LHQYLQPENATVVASVSDGHGTPILKKTALTVLDAPLRSGNPVPVTDLMGNTVVSPQGGQVEVATFRSHAADHGAAVDPNSFEVQIDWRDGTITDTKTSLQSASVQRLSDGSFGVFATHAYSAPGRFLPVITVISGGRSSVFSNRPKNSTLAG